MKHFTAVDSQQWSCDSTGCVEAYIRPNLSWQNVEKNWNTCYSIWMGDILVLVL